MAEISIKTASKPTAIVLAVLLIASNILWALKDRDNRLHYVHGIEKINRRRVYEAFTDFEKALRQNPDDPTPHFGIAWAYQLKGDEKASLEHYGRAVKLSEDILDFSLGNLQLLQKNEKIAKKRALLQQMKALQ